MLIEQDQKLMETNRNLELEIKGLRSSELRLRVNNLNLQKRITELESFLSISNVPVEETEFV